MHIGAFLALAQTPLPIKDYSVGNKFIYRYDNQIVEEVVINDTTLGSLRYSIVQSRFIATGERLQYFMRSNDSAVYQYFPALQQEKMLYKLGQSCISASILPWLKRDSLCFQNITTDSLSTNYFRYDYYGQLHLPIGGFDLLYKKWDKRYMKPYGLVSDIVKDCSRPNSNYTWADCRTSSLEMLGSVVRGVETGGNTGPIYNRWSTQLQYDTTGNTELIYGKSQRVWLRCSHLTTGKSAYSYNVALVRCILALDTSLVEITRILTAKGSHVDSISYRNGKALLHCTFITSDEYDGLGFVDIKPKGLFEPTIVLSVDNPIIVPTSAITTSTLTLSVKKSVLAFSIGTPPIQSSTSTISQESIAFGQEKSIPFRVTSPSSLPVSAFPPYLSYKISLDTTGLDNINILMPDSDTEIIPQRTIISNGNVDLYCVLPQNLSGNILGRLRVRSTSIKQRETPISIVGINAPLGFMYISTNSTLLQQTGFATFFLNSNQIAQLEQKQNIVQYIAPNPAADNLIIRYIMGAPTDNIMLELINALGVTIYSDTLSKQGYGIQDLSLDVRGMSSGMYILKIRSNTRLETHQILISR